jgi:DNA end-binding protein Ku
MRIRSNQNTPTDSYQAEGDHRTRLIESDSVDDIQRDEPQDTIETPSAPRATWKGSISFGMVMIPVKLYSATAPKDIGFHLLHRTCQTRLKNLRWCPAHEQEVPWEDVARGFEYAPDKHVVLTEEDFDSIPLPSKRVIDLSVFVPLDEIDPIYFEKSYYVTPELRAERPYAMLVKAMEQKQLAAVGKIAIRERERLCALRPLDGKLILETLLFMAEVREQQASVDSIPVSEREMEMAFQLIDYLTDEFRPEQFHDESREALRQLIDAKIEGREMQLRPLEPDDKIIDLAEALRTSLERERMRKAGNAGQQKEA